MSLTIEERRKVMSLDERALTRQMMYCTATMMCPESQTCKKLILVLSQMHNKQIATNYLGCKVAEVEQPCGRRFSGSCSVAP